MIRVDTFQNDQGAWANNPRRIGATSIESLPIKCEVLCRLARFEVLQGPRKLRPVYAIVRKLIRTLPSNLSPAGIEVITANQRRFETMAQGLSNG